MASRGYPLILLYRLLITVASLVTKHRLGWWTQKLWHTGPVHCGMWDPPGPRIKPMSHVLASRLLTTGPPGRPLYLHIFRISFLRFLVFLCFGYIFLFLHFPWHFVWMFVSLGRKKKKKTDPFPSCSWLVSYKGRPLPVSSARSSGSFSQFFCGCVCARLCKVILRRIFSCLIQDYNFCYCLSCLSALQ